MDKIYMTFVQSTTGGNGWPLNVFLTPDLKPFSAARIFRRMIATGVGVFSRCCNKLPGSGASAAKSPLQRMKSRPLGIGDEPAR